MRISRRSFTKRVFALLGAASVPPALLRAPYALAQGGEAAPGAVAAGSGPPKFVCTDFFRRFDPAYLSNGLIGIRPGPNPLAHASTLVSGFVFEDVPYRMECMSPALDPLRTNIRVNQVSLLEHFDLLTIKRQQLDTATGELLTEMVFAPGDASLQIQVLQFAPRSIPSLLCQEIRIVPSANVDLELVAAIGTEGVPGRAYETRAPERTDIDLAVGFESHGNLSRLGAAVSVLFPGGAARREEPLNTLEGATRSYHLAAKPGEALRVQTVAALVSQFYHSEPDLEAIRLALWGAELGFDALRRQNRTIWDDLWKSRVRISGDTSDQQVLDAAFFYLHSSLHPSTQTGLAPFGLSQFEHYYGHSFWDTETWSLAPVTLASPDTARSLLQYRLRGLPAARRLAALFGYRGAQFPWEAGEIDGSEVTPTFAATGWVEQHITPDVALGFWEYQLATGDAVFLHEGTWPVLEAAAEWIESRGIMTERGFEIQHIMGPDEGVPDTANNAYVNLICKMMMAAALECAAEVGVTPPSSWKKIHDTLVIPIDPTRQIVLPYEGARPGENYSLRSLDLLAVHDPPVSLKLLRRTHDYEMKVAGSQWAGLGFAVAASSATATLLGNRAQARQLFDRSWKGVWLPPFGMIREAPTQDYGCFLTNFGSLLQTAMLGFTGLRIRQGDWRAYPAVLPEGWSRIEIDRLWIRGEPKRLIAEQGSKAQLLD
jgi:trehalose/maltose hydrolase-like predicted phosphorylase